jgi:hypothetical protein
VGEKKGQFVGGQRAGAEQAQHVAQVGERVEEIKGKEIKKKSKGSGSNAIRLSVIPGES